MFVGFCKFPIVFSEIFSTFASEIGEKTDSKMALPYLATMEKYYKK